MSMHESWLLVCHPYFNIMKLWTSDPNLHLSPVDTTFCLLARLFAFLLVCLLPCLFVHILFSMFAISTMFIYFMPLSSALCIFSSIACLLVSCLCLCMYTYGARTYGVWAQFPRCKQKGCGCEHVNISQTSVFSRFRGLAFLFWFCTL